MPSPLADLYRSVANGGFGPGYGLMGIAGGASNDQGVTADELYDVFLVPDAEAPWWQWREGVLPFCYWGCIVYSCITPEGEVIGFDEGRWVDEPMSLEDWLRGWIDGSLIQPTAAG